MKSPNAAQAAVDMLLNIEKAAIITSKLLQPSVQSDSKRLAVTAATTTTSTATIPNTNAAAAIESKSEIKTISDVPVNDVRAVDEVRLAHGGNIFLFSPFPSLL